jgi:uncharacterized protein (UPF0212 family)
MLCGALDIFCDFDKNKLSACVEGLNDNQDDIITNRHDNLKLGKRKCEKCESNAIFPVRIHLVRLLLFIANINGNNKVNATKDAKHVIQVTYRRIDIHYSKNSIFKR